MIESLSCVRIAIPEEREEMAREFYGEVLELSELDGPENLPGGDSTRSGGVWYRLGDGHRLFLAPEKSFVPTHVTHPVFRVRSREEALARFAEYMFEIEWPADSESSEEFYVYDPFGNRVAFHHDAHASRE